MKHLLIILTFLYSGLIIGQESAYGDGEWFKFRVHYGLITAGYATLQVDQTRLNGKSVYHVKGEGKTTGMAKFFFPVEDYYQTYIDVDKDIPYRFIRKIDEGGYTKDIQIDFDHEINEARVIDNKKNTQEFINFPEQVQDMVSAFYYLRNNLDVTSMKVGETIDMNMFFDKSNYKFRLKFLGRETLKTDFGKVPTLIFRPYVQSGRVFEEQESLTVWVTDDKNKMPILIKASLVVGSLKASLTEYKGLQHSFKILMN